MRRLATILIPLAVAGCATLGERPASLAGSEWRVTAIDGAPPVGEATLAFRADRLVASAGCNRMGGTWRSVEGKLVVGPLMGTKMFCDGKMDQERALSALLAAEPALALSGKRMTLSSTAHRAELVRMR